MAEPTSTTGAAGAALVAIATSLVGAKYGALVTVAGAALMGTFISLGEVATEGRLDALKYVGRYVGMAVFIAGTAAWLIEKYTGVPAAEILALVAFVIGWVGGRWREMLDAAIKAVGVLLGRKGAGQ